MAVSVHFEYETGLHVFFDLQHKYFNTYDKNPPCRYVWDARLIYNGVYCELMQSFARASFLWAITLIKRGLPSALTDDQAINDHFGDDNLGSGDLPIGIKGTFMVQYS